VSITKSVVIVGAGSSGGYPTAKITNNQAAGVGIDISGASVQLRNIWFEEEAQSNTSPTVYYSNANGFMRIKGCYFQLNNYSTVGAFVTGDCETTTIQNTTFVSTATSIATQPALAFGILAGATSVQLISLDGVTVDGGEYGWSNYWAVEISQNASNLPTYLEADSLSLLRGSDMRVDENTLGYINATTQTGGVRIDWDGV
jgi:hypothetical protein